MQPGLTLCPNLAPFNKRIPTIFRQVRHPADNLSSDSYRIRRAFP